MKFMGFFSNRESKKLKHSKNDVNMQNEGSYFFETEPQLSCWGMHFGVCKRDKCLIS